MILPKWPDRDQQGVGADARPTSAPRTASSAAHPDLAQAAAVTTPAPARGRTPGSARPRRAGRVAPRSSSCVPRLGLVDDGYLPPTSRIAAALADEAGHRRVLGGARRHPRRLGARPGHRGRAGVALGMVIGSVPVLRAVTASTIEFLRPIPSVALIPLAVLLYGTDLRLDPAAGRLRRRSGRCWSRCCTACRRRPGRRRDRPQLPARPLGPGPLRGLADRAAVRHDRHPAGRPVALILAITAELVIGAPGLGKRDRRRPDLAARCRRCTPWSWSPACSASLINLLARAGRAPRCCAWHPSVRGGGAGMTDDRRVAAGGRLLVARRCRVGRCSPCWWFAQRRQHRTSTRRRCATILAAFARHLDRASGSSPTCCRACSGCSPATLLAARARRRRSAW